MLKNIPSDTPTRDVSGALPTNGSRFHQLAEDLIAEHERETIQLRSEVECLRSLVGARGKCEPPRFQENGQTPASEASALADTVQAPASEAAGLPALPENGQFPTSEAAPASEAVPASDAVPAAEAVLVSEANAAAEQPTRRSTRWRASGVSMRASWFGGGGGKRVSRFSSDGLRPSNIVATVPRQSTAAELAQAVVLDKVGRLSIPDGMKEGIAVGLDFLCSIEGEPKRVGPLARIALSHRFAFICALVIVANAVVTVLEANLDMDQALAFDGNYEELEVSTSMKVLETCFTSFYILELLLRLTVHRFYFFVNEDWRWNVLDFVIVTLAVVDMRFVFHSEHDSNGPDLNFLRMLRICKIVKVFRVIRMIKSVEELRLMFECVLNSFTQLVWSFLMILFVLYVFALVFVQALAGYALENWDSIDDRTKWQIEFAFGDVWKSMISLFQAVTGGVDWVDHWHLIGRSGQLAQLTYLFYIAFFAIAAWNIVTSTFVEKAFELAVPSLDGLISEKHRRDAVCANEMMQLLRKYVDVDNDGLITVQEFNKHIQDPHILDLFAVRGLDVKDARTFFHMLLSLCDDSDHNDRVDLNTFVGCALRLQGLASSLDLQTVHFNMKRMYRKTVDRLGRLEILLVNLLAQKALSANDGTRGAAFKSMKAAVADDTPYGGTRKSARKPTFNGDDDSPRGVRFVDDDVDGDDTRLASLLVEEGSPCGGIVKELESGLLALDVDDDMFPDLVPDPTPLGRQVSRPREHKS